LSTTILSAKSVDGLKELLFAAHDLVEIGARMVRHCRHGEGKCGN
jgi:hypothetical protein